MPPACLARAVAVCLALAPLTLRAQPPAPASAGPRAVATNTNAWLMYFGDHAVARRWALHAEAQVRRAEVFDGLQQLLLRPGLIYTLTPNARATAGYAFVRTWPYGEQPAAARFDEHRTWQQLQVGHATGRVAWQHRYRLEQRWVDVPVNATTSDRRYTNRMRYLARATLPLRGRALDPGEPYASVYDEVMVNWGRNVGRNVFDQNRAYAALGWRFAGATRAEAGYLQQLVLKADCVRMERNHTLQLGIFQSAPLRR